MDAALTDLPVEIIQYMAYIVGGLTPADVRALCLTCKALNYALHGDGNEHDRAQHRALFGLRFCLESKWPRAAALALKRGLYDEGENMTTCLEEACKHGYTDVVELLLAFPEVEPSRETSRWDDKNACSLACMHGHTDVVKLLLADPRVDPAADDNYAIRWASDNGHTDLVALLRADPRVAALEQEQ